MGDCRVCSFCWLHAWMSHNVPFCPPCSSSGALLGVCVGIFGGPVAHGFQKTRCVLAGAAFLAAGKAAGRLLSFPAGGGDRQEKTFPKTLEWRLATPFPMYEHAATSTLRPAISATSARGPPGRWSARQALALPWAARLTCCRHHLQYSRSLHSRVFISCSCVKYGLAGTPTTMFAPKGTGEQHLGVTGAGKTSPFRRPAEHHNCAIAMISRAVCARVCIIPS